MLLLCLHNLPWTFVACNVMLESLFIDIIVDSIVEFGECQSSLKGTWTFGQTIQASSLKTLKGLLTMVTISFGTNPKYLDRILFVIYCVCVSFREKIALKFSLSIVLLLKYRGTRFFISTKDPDRHILRFLYSSYDNILEVLIYQLEAFRLSSWN